MGVYHSLDHDDALFSSSSSIGVYDLNDMDLDDGFLRGFKDNGKLRSRES
jgi:hypothetical protein